MTLTDGYYQILIMRSMNTKPLTSDAKMMDDFITTSKLKDTQYNSFQNVLKELDSTGGSSGDFNIS